MMTNSVPPDNRSVPTLQRAVMTGAIGFSFVSLVVFATVAFGEPWLYERFRITGSYVVWIALFILLGGAVLGSLVVGRWRLPRFYLLYGLAFLLYSVGWVAAYSTLRESAGEWVGSLAGSILMALVFATGFKRISSFAKFALILFVTNSIGYF